MKFSVSEHSTARYIATLRDEDGVVVGPSVLTDVRLWVRPTYLGATYIRENVAALNQNGVLIYDIVATRGYDQDGLAVAGNLVWQLSPTDTAIQQPSARGQEEHEAVFDFTWATGRRTHKVLYFVLNLYPISG